MSCHGGSNWWRPLYPQKLPRQWPIGASAKGHNRTHAPHMINETQTENYAARSKSGAGSERA